ncbi:MAG: helical backbone metal receptor [Bdellovibrionales bacterium]
MKRVISMVPSWTETLIESGVEVVGRTRFCVHPQDKIQKIKAVGGTKEIQWDLVRELYADLLLLDREENPKSMAEESPLPVFDTHVTDLRDLPAELSRLAERFSSRKLEEFSGRWQKVGLLSQKNRSLERLPGVKKWLKPYSGQTDFLYLIWKNPWMAVGEHTFIDSMLKHLGFTKNALAHNSARIKYPQVDLSTYDPEKTLLLFSSEPYPFHKRHDFAQSLPFSSAIVDGEAWSWFGLRSLRFLEKSLNL